MRETAREKVARLLGSGVSRAEIARQLGVSPGTVTRHARLLGYPDARKRVSPVDWSQVQAFYDAGHSIDECRDRFGFSYGAWDKAVVRGDLVTRRRSKGELGMATRDRVEDLFAKGFTQAQICRELGLSKSSVAYHARKLGHRADPRFARRYDWADVQAAIDSEGLSMRQCRARFGFSAESWRRAVDAGRIIPRPYVIPIEELLVVGRKATSRTYLKARLLKEGLKENRCEGCGATHWRGKHLSLELHHRNGDGTDNRLVNLQILCPNCHSQTPSWGGRNRHRLGRAA